MKVICKAHKTCFYNGSVVFNGKCIHSEPHEIIATTDISMSCISRKVLDTDGDILDCCCDSYFLRKDKLDKLKMITDEGSL